MAWIITILYSLCMLFIFLFSLSQLHLTWIYIRQKKRSRKLPSPLISFPAVTIQLPVFNEKFVVERLIHAVSAIDYPKEQLEIQILDDSTDETTALIIMTIESLRPLLLDIKLIHRENRTGFKAGALENGLAMCRGEFIAIFDADFIPPTDFLHRTLPYFEDNEVGMVQTRWAHLNKDYSILTELQAFGLDAHFSIEQTARNSGGSFINFNGTCGVWRKRCIEDAGGWSADTLTEDLDLSYRAQMKNWKFIFNQDVGTPGELPVIMPSIKSQQYRWNKGAAETAKKHLYSVLKNSHISLVKKIHAFFHLLNSSVFVSVFLASILSVPILYFKNSTQEFNAVFNLGSIFFLGFFSIAIFYWHATKSFNQKPALKFIKLFPTFLVITMGLSFHNAVAVMEGFLGRRTPFVRTPKFNIVSTKDKITNRVYGSVAITSSTILEAVLCLYFLFAVLLAFFLKDFSLLLFHLMLALGFGAVFYFSVKK